MIPVRQRRASATAAAGFKTAEEMRAAVRAVAGDAEAWRTVRPRVVAFLGRSHAKDAAAAGRIADAYFRRPALIPQPPPRGYVPPAEE